MKRGMDVRRFGFQSWDDGTRLYRASRGPAILCPILLPSLGTMSVLVWCSNQPNPLDSTLSFACTSASQPTDRPPPPPPPSAPSLTTSSFVYSSSSVASCSSSYYYNRYYRYCCCCCCYYCRCYYYTLYYHCGYYYYYYYYHRCCRYSFATLGLPPAATYAAL